MNENTFIEKFFFCFDLFWPLCFSLLSAFLSSNPFKIIRNIVNSLIPTSKNVLLKYNWKKILNSVLDPKQYTCLPNTVNTSLIIIIDWNIHPSITSWCLHTFKLFVMSIRWRKLTISFCKKLFSCINYLQLLKQATK